MSTRMSDLTALARFLQRVEARKPIDPKVYRSLVLRIMHALKSVQHGKKLAAAFLNYPVLAELYENLYYESFGLCCSAEAEAESARTETLSILAHIRGKKARNER